MAEFEVGGHTYKAARLPLVGTGSAFHIGRRLAPLMMGNSDGKAMASVLAEMDDDQLDYVIRWTLKVVQRKEPNGTGWSRITVPSTGDLQFDDINFVQMTEIITEVLRENMGDFFSAADSLSSATQAAASEA